MPSVAQISRRGSVHRTNLSRAVSCGTQEALFEVSAQQEPMPEISEKIRKMFRNPNEHSEYLKSVQFAEDLVELSNRAGAIFEEEQRMLSLQSPIYVFGDVHGNLTDLHYFSNHMWNFGMELTAGSFLFLGDYVDRGQHGLEVRIGGRRGGGLVPTCVRIGNVTCVAEAHSVQRPASLLV
jgi:hypothetical protein